MPYRTLGIYLRKNGDRNLTQELVIIYGLVNTT